MISVHLQLNASGSARRKHELSTIAEWIDDHDGTERDFIIVGDMNIENADELADAMPAGFLSLNDECVSTNTNVNGPKPFDHVMYNPSVSTEIDQQFDFIVGDLGDLRSDGMR